MAYLTDIFDSGCFGGGVFVDENDSDGASFDVHLTSRPLEDVQLTSADSDAAVAVSSPQAITFAPEYSTGDVPYFEERSVLVRFLTEILDDFRRFVDEIWRF